MNDEHFKVITQVLERFSKELDELKKKIIILEDKDAIKKNLDWGVD